MCGICGIALADRGARVDPQRLDAMNRALKHRGPDDEGVWHVGHASLAMRRLSIIDPLRGTQPLFSVDGSLVLVYNGELYNFRELRQELEGRGHSFHTDCDSEVVLRAIEAYGDDALNRFNGMFALAVYDTGRDRLLLARDHAGIKPLFYTQPAGVLAFASELNALVQSGFVDRTLNASALDTYFASLYIPTPDTIYAGASKLPPAHKLVFEKGRVLVEPYWVPKLIADQTWNKRNAAERCSELLQTCVQDQCVSDVPLGAFLSGGVDSSAIVAAMSKHAPSAVKTFSIGFDDAHADELRYARRVAKHFETDHTEELLQPDMTQVAESLVRHFGEPFADSSAIPTWFVSRLARRRVTVALSGDGGDELFAGYTWLHMTRQVNRYRKVPSPFRGIPDLALRAFPASAAMGKFRRFSSDSFLSPRDAFRRRQTTFSADLRARLYKPDLTSQITERNIDRFNELADRLAEYDVDTWMLAQDFGMYLPDDILAKVDRMSMANSLEARVPLLDRRMVDFAFSLPFNLKLRNGVSKYILKRALKSVLPEEILAQRKQGFSIPIHRWFREQLRVPFLEQVLAPDSRCRTYLNSSFIEELLRVHVSGVDNYGHHLWALLMFELWLRYSEGLHPSAA